MVCSAAQPARGRPRRRDRALRGDGGPPGRRAFVLGMAYFGLAVHWGATMAGCGPSETAAKPGERPPALAVGALTPGPPEPEPGPAVAAAAEVMPEYVLPFEARANPFAPPEPTPDDQSVVAGPVEQAVVRLMGVMNDGERSMAGIEIDGERQIVFAGATLRPGSDAGELRIVEIRDSEIVVEQSGKQWVVPLPQP